MTCVLAIETSCDETSVAIVNKDYRILAQTTRTQEEHSRFGGVVPEVAARRHYELLPLLFQKTLQEAGLKMPQIDFIAVTNGPGLIGSLLVGLSFAKGLAYAFRKPLVGIHHLEAHIASVRLIRPEWEFPALALIASGGHTHLVLLSSWTSFRVIAKTRDDAIGEAFDKTAKMLELGYPGGPIIDRLSRRGDPHRYLFAVPNMRDESMDFSYSGLKTSVLHMLKQKPELFQPKTEGNPSQDTLDLLASFQECAVEQLIDRLKKSLMVNTVKSLFVVGGVAANSLLRQKVEDLVRSFNLELGIPGIEFCTDNAAMVGAAAFTRIHDAPSLLTFDYPTITGMDARATWPLDS